MNANATASAFPLIFTGDPNAQCYGAGLTKRELFAAMAMQGLLTNEGFVRSCLEESQYMTELTARYAVRHADALIAALNVGGEG